MALSDFACERLIAAALYAPRHFDTIKAILPPEDVADPHLALVWSAMLNHDAAGKRVDVNGLAAYLAGDGGAMAAIAGLPDDMPWDEWVPRACELVAEERMGGGF